MQALLSVIGVYCNAEMKFRNDLQALFSRTARPRAGTRRAPMKN